MRKYMYNDIAGNCTSGIGNLVHKGNCSTAELSTDTSAQNETQYQLNRSKVVSIVNRDVTTSLNQWQFDALVDFTFNTGTLGGTGVLRAVNGGNNSAVPAQLGLWIHANGKVIQALVNRRAAEGRIFTLGQYPNQCK